MRLFAALTAALLKALLIVGGLMLLLFAGALVMGQAGPHLRQVVETPQRLHELQNARERDIVEAARQLGLATTHQARIVALDRQRELARAAWEEETRKELNRIAMAAHNQAQETRRTVAESRRAVEQSTRRMEARYCASLNPVDWWTCRTLRAQIERLEASAALQRQAVARSARQIETRARQDAARFRTRAEERLNASTAELEAHLQESNAALAELEASRTALLAQARSYQAEEERLRRERWLVLEFQKRWPGLLGLALLIALSPYIRRTLWYFVGLPLLTRARQVQLAPPLPASDEDGPEASPQLRCTSAERTLTLPLSPGERLLARPGYILSDRQGASTALFFDRRAPNISFISGLTLLTRLDGTQAPENTGKSDTRTPEIETPREVLLGSPHDADAYLMRVDLHDHPGLVFRASRVVAVRGDIRIEARWRLFNLHAWATSQVRFLIFSGTGSLILEGYGDVSAHTLTSPSSRAEKRQPNVLGFDTRLSYSTRRAATFLPYLLDPEREPLVVDLFEGRGTYFFEKNPAARQRHRSPAEAVAGFFLDAIRRLLGI
ncbi:hypothetical protein FRC98_17310 [Lujinxingia vulgaris]|uniref:Uncharacterized protein n=1 Tax=Lujinxingia vulgaris TaxID=2600176 RepID=A0A5C6X4S0_9DELT|nr:AIM24 family protein [Lujinxingia vulgaris]TXD35224.1 hypothetical protein FRC98_17310 [Lujinxingia vulgaris]